MQGAHVMEFQNILELVASRRKHGLEIGMWFTRTLADTVMIPSTHPAETVSDLPKQAERGL